MIATARQIGDAFIRVGAAIDHLIEKHGEQSAASQISSDAKFSILIDEINELRLSVIREGYGVSKPGHTLNDELAQVAAVAIAWLASRQTTEEA